MKDHGTHIGYLCAWVDDIIVCDIDPMSTINSLQEKYKLKGVGKPEYYLGSDFEWKSHHDGKEILTGVARHTLRNASQHMKVCLVS